MLGVYLLILSVLENFERRFITCFWFVGSCLHFLLFIHLFIIPPGEEFYPADIPPSLDVSHPEFCPPTSHLLRMSHIRNFVRRHPTFSGCLTSEILSGRHSTFSGCLTFGILSGRHPIFSGCLTSGILSGRHPTFSGCLTSGILSGQRSTFSGCLTSGILSGRCSAFSGCLTSGIPFRVLGPKSHIFNKNWLPLSFWQAIFTPPLF